MIDSSNYNDKLDRTSKQAHKHARGQWISIPDQQIGC